MADEESTMAAKTRKKSPPRPPRADPVSIGVTAVRRPVPADPRTIDERTVVARVAGEASALFPKAGEAFERWCNEKKGINPQERRVMSDWTELLEEFARRPIHGYRRGHEGGNHRR